MTVRGSMNVLAVAVAILRIVDVVVQGCSQSSGSDLPSTPMDIPPCCLLSNRWMDVGVLEIA